MLTLILTLLEERPRTVGELAADLDEPRDVVELGLRQLHQRGYVDRAYEGAGHCPSCGGCSMKRLCPSQGNPSPTQEVWRKCPTSSC